MSSAEIQDRISQLLAQAEEAVRNDNLQKGSELLKEASHLDSDNVRVKETWLTLQKREQTGDVLELLRNYLLGGRQSDGQKIMQTLKQKRLPQAEAEEAIRLLLEPAGEADFLDSLTATLLYVSVDARKELAERLCRPFSELFDQLFERGEESFKALATLAFDEAVWTSRDKQVAAQKDLFRLGVAKLMDVGVDHLDRPMQLIARQLSMAPDNVKNLVDEDIFDVVLVCLDIRRDPTLRRQTMLVTSKLLETTKERGETLFGHFITSKVAKQTNDDLIIAFSVAAAVFPMVPAVAASLFMTDGFVQQLVPNLERNSEAASQGQRYSRAALYLK